LLELESILSEAGAEIVGRCQTVRAALGLTPSEGLCAAILDLQIGRETIAPVARDLEERGVPFVFYTGQVGMDPIRAEWPQAKVVHKPASARAIVAALSEAMTRHAQQQGA